MEQLNQEIKVQLSDEEALRLANGLTPDQQNNGLLNKISRFSAVGRNTSRGHSSCPAMSPTSDSYISHQAYQENYQEIAEKQDDIDSQYSNEAKNEAKQDVSGSEVSLADLILNMSGLDSDISTGSKRGTKDFSDTKYRGRGVFGRNYKKKERTFI